MAFTRLKIRDTAVPDVRASAMRSPFLYAGCSKSCQDAGAARPFFFRNDALNMKQIGSIATPVQYPSGSRYFAGMASAPFGTYASKTPSFFPATNASAMPPKKTSTCGLSFSPMIRARTSPDEKRRCRTWIPVSFVNALKTSVAYRSDQIV